MKELQHLALIMDGNGRWAEKRNLSRTEGHKEGVKVALEIAKGCILENIPYLTLFCFSTENWQRPVSEVNFLMGLFSSSALSYIDKINELGIKILHSGNMLGLPKETQDSLKKLIDKTKDNNKLTLILAINYGGLDEIVRAANKVLKMGLALTEESILSERDNPFVPLPDMICRSSGEERLSGFLLMESSYAELGFYPELWPDWKIDMVKRIKEDYYSRKRKFGGLDRDE